MSYIKAMTNVLKENFIKVKDSWIDDEAVNCIMKIVSQEKTGTVEFGCYNDSMYFLI